MSRPLLDLARAHELDMQSNLRMYRDSISRLTPSMEQWASARRFLAEAADHAAVATALRAMDAEQGVEP